MYVQARGGGAPGGAQPGPAGLAQAPGPQSTDYSAQWAEYYRSIG